MEGKTILYLVFATYLTRSTIQDYDFIVYVARVCYLSSLDLRIFTHSASVANRV